MSARDLREDPHESPDPPLPAAAPQLAAPVPQTPPPLQKTVSQGSPPGPLAGNPKKQPPIPRVAVRLRARIGAVDEKIAQMQAFREELARNLRRCERAESESRCCPVVLDLASGPGREEEE